MLAPMIGILFPKKSEITAITKVTPTPRKYFFTLIE